jgi:hypothetical protein
MAEQRLLEARRPVDLVGGEKDSVAVEGEGPQVEELVVEYAQGESVRFPVRSASLMPANMGRV